MIRRVAGAAQVEYHDSLPSTNNRARELENEGAHDWSVVWAGVQTAGRGRRGRRWQAGTGEGLLVSVLLPEAWAPMPQAPSLAVGLAVARVLDGWLAPGSAEPVVEVKWPNDLMVEGKKVAGVLCERWSGERLGRIVAGVGVNLTQSEDDFPQEIRDGATSMRMLGAGSVDGSQLLADILEELRSMDGETAEEVLAGLQARDHLEGARVVGEDGVQGVASGLDPSGSLRIRTAEGVVVHLVAGSVRLVPQGE
ncbi:MAG: biotin--[acetyl-CoA-carboxylase] ligase [Gemmatimonadota bacterium]